MQQIAFNSPLAGDVMNTGRILRDEADRLKAGIRIADVIGVAVPLKRDGRALKGRCPFHEDRTPSFHVYDDHYHCFGCGAHGDVITWMMRAKGLSFPEAVAHLAGTPMDRFEDGREVRTTEPIAPRADVDAANRRELARRIWTESVDARGTVAETYLQNRGVRPPDRPVIRFHPFCPRSGGALPAMIALMTDPATGKPCGVHRTFLAADGSGKAQVERPKMMLGAAGVIRLDDPIGEGLGLAEGIETALSVIQTIGWRPVWAAGTRGGIERFPILPSHCLSIFADGDTPGQDAAKACATRWAAAGREVWIHTPPPGEDWNSAAGRLAA